MVSTDGPAVTPGDADDPQRKHLTSENASDTETAVQEESSSAPPETNGNGAPAAPEKKKRKKKKKASGRLERGRRIDRLVMEFQPDAVEIEHRKVAGGLRWTLYTVVLLLIATVTWAIWAKVDRVVVAQGKIIPVGQPVVIQAMSQAPILKIHVEFGDHVRAGDVVATFDSTFSQSDVDALTTQVNGLDAKLSRLRAQRDRVDFVITGYETDSIWINEREVFRQEKMAFDAKLEEYAATMRQLDVKRARFVDEKEMFIELVDVRQDMYEINLNLNQQGTAVSSRELAQSRMELVEAKTRQRGAENQIKETDEEIKAAETTETAFIAETNAKISVAYAETGQEFKAKSEELTKAQHALTYVVRTVPDDLEHKEFVVTEVSDLSGGGTMKGGDPIAKLMPIDNVEFEAEVKVEGKDIARIRAASEDSAEDNSTAQNDGNRGDRFTTGDEVRVKLSSFPFMRHGTLNGTVRAISEDAKEEGEPPMTRTFYTVRVKIPPNQKLKDVPPDFRLVPGMTVTAEIKIGRRRVIDYFLYPILRALDSSFREP